MSDPKGKTSNEDVKVTKTTGWSLDASRKAIIKLVDKWRIAREIPDDFVKKHLETFISVLYQAQVKDMDTAKVLLDGLKQDLVGGSQTSDNKLWGFKEGAYAILCSNKCLLSSVLIRNILKLTALSKTPVTWSDKDLIENSDQNNFWSGFFSELYSVGPLKRITPITNKTSMYATGVACMRYEIYNLIRKDSKQIGSQYWYPVDTSVSGDPIKKTKKYLSIFLGTYAGSALLSKLITQCLIRYHATYKEQIGKRVVFASFLKDAKATVALFNRYKVEKEKGKGKKGKTTERRVIIKPTKPSRLATILAVE